MIDPGELFGAGTHPTTQLCLELLLELEPGGPLCDWGAGSGILAIAAARLGFGPVDAVEVMPDGLEAIARNAAANGVSVRTHWLNLAATPAPWAPTVTANLTLELLAAIAADSLERPPERMIASGVLAERADEVGDGVRAPRPARGGAARAGRVGGRAAGAGVIRLAVRVARADAEAVLAELLELAPGGLEERELDERRGRVRDLRRARRAAGAARPARRGGRRAGRRLQLGGARRLVRALEGVPPAGRRELALPPAARAAALGGAARTATASTS